MPYSVYFKIVQCRVLCTLTSICVTKQAPGSDWVYIHNRWNTAVNSPCQHRSGCPESSNRADLHREISFRSPNSRTPRIFRIWMMTQRIFWCSEFRDPLIRLDSGYFSWCRYFRVCESLSNPIDHFHDINSGREQRLRERKSLEPNEHTKQPGLTIVNIWVFHNLDQSAQPRQKSNVLSWEYVYK